MAGATSIKYKREQRREGSKGGGHLISKHLDAPTSRHVTSRHVASRQLVSTTHLPRSSFPFYNTRRLLSLVDEKREPGSRHSWKHFPRLKPSSSNFPSTNSSHSFTDFSSSPSNTNHTTLKSLINQEPCLHAPTSPFFISYFRDYTLHHLPFCRENSEYKYANWHSLINLIFILRGS